MKQDRPASEILGRKSRQRTRPQGWKQSENFVHQRARIGKSVASRLERNNCDSQFSDVLFTDHVAVHGDENVELFLCAIQKQAVLHPSPADQGHRLDLMSGQIATKSPIQVFVEQNPQLRLAAALVV
jgi:hypothetical protein